MNSQLKPSMFNYSTQIDNNLVLYNSMIGISSICKVDDNKKQKVLSLLNAEQIESDEYDQDLKKLQEYGFLVNYEKNEKNARNLLYGQYVFDGVLNLVLHTTKQCNFRCEYCYLDFKSEPMSEDVQDSVVKFIEKNLYKYNCVKINWFGGEPLLEMGVIENISKRVMEICKRAKKPYYATVTTNGYLLTKENIKKLIKYRVDSYTITIDGLYETHDRLRHLKGNKPSFTTIINNLLYIKNEIKCSRLRITIRSNLTKENSKYVDNYYAFFDKNFGDDRRFSLFFRPVRDVGGERIENIKSDLFSSDEFNKLLFELSSKFDGKIGLVSNYSELEPAGYTCPAICQGKYTIDVEGKVSKCDSIEDDIKIGELNKKGDLIRYGTYEEDWMTGCFDYKKECENCFFSATCFKGTCPIDRVRKCEKPCKKNHKEIDALIKMYMNSHEFKTI